MNDELKAYNDVLISYLELEKALRLFAMTPAEYIAELSYRLNHIVFDGDALPDIQSVNRANQILLEKAGLANNYAFDSDLLHDIQSINKVTKILLENAGDSDATRNN